jgi:hypothetical protein
MKDLRMGDDLYVEEKMMFYIYYQNVWRRESGRNYFFSRKWLIVNEQITYNRTTNSSNAVELGI